MKQPPLADAELAVMDLLWETAAPMTARQIREQLYPDAAKAQHGTVQRLLQRLEDKGYVERDRSLPVHLFSARVSREAYAGSQLESLAEKLTGGSLAPLITHLIEEKRISPAEIARLLGYVVRRDDDVMPADVAVGVYVMGKKPGQEPSVVQMMFQRVPPYSTKDHAALDALKEWQAADTRRRVEWRCCETHAIRLGDPTRWRPWILGATFADAAGVARPPRKDDDACAPGASPGAPP